MKLLIITISLLLITITSFAEELIQCDICGFYRSAEDVYSRADRNPNHLLQSWTNNINNVCKFCIHKLNYPERNLFNIKEALQ